MAWVTRQSFDDVVLATHITSEGVVDPGAPADGARLSYANLSSVVGVASDANHNGVLSWTEYGYACSEGCQQTGPWQRVSWVTPSMTPFYGWPTNVFGSNPGQRGVGIVLDSAKATVLALWTNNAGQGLVAKRFLQDGTAAPGWPEAGRDIPLSPTLVRPLAITTDDHSGLFMAWADSRGGNLDVYVQRLGADGLIASGWPSDGLAVCTAPFNQTNPFVTPDGAGGVFVVWTDNRSGIVDDLRLYGTRIRADGTVADGWQQDGLSMSAEGRVNAPRPVADGNGGLFVAWHQIRSGVEHILATHVLSDGARHPSWSESGNVVCNAPGAKGSIGLTRSRVNEAVACWTDDREGSTRVYVQQLVDDGVVAAQISLAFADAIENVHRIAWQLGPSLGGETRLYRRTPGADWHLFREGWASPGSRVMFDIADVPLTGRYGYRLGVSDGAEEVLSEDAWVEGTGPMGLGFAQHHNPRRELGAVEVTLKGTGPSRLEVFDVTGRTLSAQSLTSLGPGRHSIPVRIRSIQGLVFIRLSEGAVSATQRILLVR